MDMGIGIDVVNIDRMKHLSEHACQRMFHPEELKEATLLSSERRAEYLAGRFAAKEAFGKALGTGLSGLSLQEIRVERQSDGRPVLRLEGKALQLLGARKALVSISHDQPVAVAMVVLGGGADGPF